MGEDDNTESSSSSPYSNGGWNSAKGLVIKTLVVIGGALFIRRLTKSTTRRDHARLVSDSLSGLKNSQLQAARDPDHYFNLRTIACPAADMADGSKALYVEHAFWRTPQKPFRQRFYMVKPCSKEMNCDVELSTYAIRDMEEYKNFCDRPKDQRPLPEEVIGDIAEHLTTVPLKRCERGKRCLYEGTTPPGGFPNNWSGAAYCTSELAIFKNNEIHVWDRGYDDDGNQVWGVKEGAYEFKPASSSAYKDSNSPLTLLTPLALEKRIEGSFVLQECQIVGIPLGMSKQWLEWDEASITGSRDRTTFWKAVKEGSRRPKQAVFLMEFSETSKASDSQLPSYVF